MNLLQSWRCQLAENDDCPWPGPRPMRDADIRADALLGRARDAKEVARLIRGHGVVVLTGTSGVGKTSALYMAVRPQLQRWDRVVMLCDTWNPEGDFDAAMLIGKQVEQDLPSDILLSDDGPSWIDQLDVSYPDRAVVILDQFEELIRYRPDAYRKVLAWIKETAETSSVRIVISMRIEYEHELTRELKTSPFMQTRFELLPIEDEKYIRQIISRGVTEDDEPGAADEAAAALLEHWRDSFDSAGWSEVGLLHLQATLYSLWNSKSGNRIELDDVKDMVSVAVERDDNAVKSVGVKLFEHGLASSVKYALDHCRKACQQVGIDAHQSTRTRELAVHMSDFLSSGGYKISLNRDDLARRVLTSDASRTTWDGLTAARVELARQVEKAAKIRNPKDLTDDLDWLSRLRSTLPAWSPEADASRAAGQRKRVRPRSVRALTDKGERKAKWPWQADPDDLTGGMLLGLRPTESAIEEIRSFHFALEWLRASELIRVTSTERDTTMVSLIHDRFAAGLDRWKEVQRTGILEAVARVSAIKGEVLDWSAKPRDEENEEEAVAPPSVIANVRWTDCYINDADFAGTTFVNCDFRGSTFKRCRFTGVSLVNCLLDDVEFFRCAIIGRPADHPGNLTAAQKRDQPAFHVHAPDLVTLLNKYREGDVKGGLLFSQTAGVAAVPEADDHQFPNLVPFVDGDDEKSPKGSGLPALGGLTMFGGRLSSLKFRSCDFFDDGVLALRHVAGTSVELAEQREVNLEVFGAALRGLTVTQPIDDLVAAISNEDGVKDPDGPFQLRFEDSLIINTWFGAGIAGSATLKECVVWQIFNGSESFAVRLPNSRLLGGVNVDDSSAAKLDDLVPGELYEIRREVIRGSENIDFRTNPAKYEIEKYEKEG